MGASLGNFDFFFGITLGALDGEEDDGLCDGDDVTLTVGAGDGRAVVARLGEADGNVVNIEGVVEGIPCTED